MVIGIRHQPCQTASLNARVGTFLFNIITLYNLFKYIPCKSSDSLNYFSYLIHFGKDQQKVSGNNNNNNKDMM